MLGLLTGMALGVSGALIQAVTRNPLADTQILGVNSGAALLVVFAIGVLGLTGIWSYVWFAFAGVAGAMVLVYALGSAGRGGATVEGRERLRLLNASLITDVRDAADGLKVSVEHLPTGRHETLDADLLIYATGYRPLDVGVLLGEAAKLCVRDEEDAIRVGRDHRVEVLPKVTAGIYLQGATEHSHGLGSTLLSTTAIRAGEIRDSLLARLGEPVRATRART